MYKIITISLAAAFLVLAAGSASAAFSVSNLKGTYVLQVHGFQSTGPPLNVGEIGVLGLLKFDGKGGVKAGGSRRVPGAWVTASLICTAVAAGNSDHNSAIVPVTKGAATLVPPSVSGCPSALKLVTASPGAVKPRLPIELPRFDSFIGLPRRLQATTGMTHG
jgi:hypothetical protein